MRPYALIACAALTAAATLHAQSFATHPCGDNSDDRGMISRLFTGAEQACELRSTTSPSSTSNSARPTAQSTPTSTAPHGTALASTSPSLTAASPSTSVVATTPDSPPPSTP